MTLPKLILMLAYILFSAAVIRWEKKKLSQQKLVPQTEEGNSSLGNMILKIMLAGFTGLAVMLLVVISGLFNESLFFLLLLPSVVVAVIAAVLVGWNIRKESFPHPIALIGILGIWIFLYLFTTGIKILTVESMVQLFILFIVLSARGLILRSSRKTSGSSS